jgi:hypothetical protein
MPENLWKNSKNISYNEAMMKRDAEAGIRATLRITAERRLFCNLSESTRSPTGSLVAILMDSLEQRQFQEVRRLFTKRSQD